METSNKAIRAMSEIVKRYPQGTASLFTGAGIKAPANGRNLAKAIRRGHITARQLYSKTLGSNFDNFNVSGVLNNARIVNPGSMPTAAQASPRASKFENIVNGLLNTATQAADIYGKFKNPGQNAAADQSAMNQPEAKSPPWGLIAAGAGLVIVLVVVLIMLKKK